MLNIFQIELCVNEFENVRTMGDLTRVVTDMARLAARQKQTVGKVKNPDITVLSP